jgi:5,5'-dehydrodivanillate O-demethylase
MYVDRLFWYVPIDDEHCITFVLNLIPIRGESAKQYEQRSKQAEQALTPSANEIAEAILQGKMSVRDIGENVNTYYLFWIEDYLSLVGQGAIADRSTERLGRMDSGVILLRKLWERELRALAEGQPLTSWTSPAGLADQSVIPTHQNAS